MSKYAPRANNRRGLHSSAWLFLPQASLAAHTRDRLMAFSQHIRSPESGAACCASKFQFFSQSSSPSCTEGVTAGASASSRSRSTMGAVLALGRNLQGCARQDVAHNISTCWHCFFYGAKEPGGGPSSSVRQKAVNERSRQSLLPPAFLRCHRRAVTCCV